MRKKCNQDDIIIFYRETKREEKRISISDAQMTCSEFRGQIEKFRQELHEAYQKLDSKDEDGDVDFNHIEGRREEYAKLNFHICTCSECEKWFVSIKDQARPNLCGMANMDIKMPRCSRTDTTSSHMFYCVDCFNHFGKEKAKIQEVMSKAAAKSGKRADMKSFDKYEWRRAAIVLANAKIRQDPE